MLRLDPGDVRVATTRQFQVWEGGGEYNVARGLRRCFGLKTAVVTALADNPVGRLVEDMMLQGGVDQSHVKWVKYDGVGRTVRNGLNFTERGFGVRAALGCSDRGHTAVSQLKPGEIDWDEIFGKEGSRWLHTGRNLLCAERDDAGGCKEAMIAAHKHGTIISYDLNYRDSLWKSIGGKARATEVNRELASYVDVMIGNEEDFTAALGFQIEGVGEDLGRAGFGQLPQDDPESRGGLSELPCGGDDAAPREDCDGQRLGRGVLLRGRVPRGAAHAGPGDFRPRGRRRLVCFGADLWLFEREGRGLGGQLRLRTWRSGNDYAGRYYHGDVRRGAAYEGWRRRIQRNGEA